MSGEACPGSGTRTARPLDAGPGRALLAGLLHPLLQAGAVPAPRRHPTPMEPKVTYDLDADIADTYLMPIGLGGGRFAWSLSGCCLQ